MSILMSIFILFVFAGCGKEPVPDTPPEGVLTVTAFNAGKADAFLLQSRGHVMVIDTATDDQGAKMVDFLRAQNIDTIDELLITHYDKDHVGGADKLIDAFKIGKIYTSYQVKDSDDTEEFFDSMRRNNLNNIEVSEVISYEADGVIYTIYPPQDRTYEKDESNNSSLVTKVSLGDKSMLFTGDAEKIRIKELLKLNDEALESDILKMPHHGQNEDNMKKLLKAVAPAYAIITSSETEPADEEVVKLLNDMAIETYFTKDGDITIQMTESSIQIQQ